VYLISSLQKLIEYSEEYSYIEKKTI